ncbi:MAG TPA: OsmC family protein, partial [Rubricoccaceae bacterium]
MPIRSADAEWRGALRDGSGDVRTESGALSSPYSFNSRFGSGTDDGSSPATNPEELLAAAHAGCFTMAVSNELASAGHPPERAHTTARVHVEQVSGGFEIPTIELELEASVPGIDDAEFQRIATHAKENCPLSKVLRAADIRMTAR